MISKNTHCVDFLVQKKRSKTSADLAGIAGAVTQSMDIRWDWLILFTGALVLVFYAAIAGRLFL